MSRRRPYSPPPEPGQVWIEHRREAGAWRPTGRELWVRRVGVPRRQWGGSDDTVQGDSVREDKVRRVEIYERNVRAPRWQLARGRVAGPIPSGRQRAHRRRWRAQGVLPLPAQ